MTIHVNQKSAVAWRGSALLCGAWALALCLGCGGDDDPRKYHVSGTVTYGNEPLPGGAIVFEPNGSQGNSGPAGFASIKDGRFDTRNGKGVIGGPYRVKINGTDGTPPEEDEELGLFPAGKPLFNEHEISIDLPSEDSTQQFEISE